MGIPSKHYIFQPSLSYYCEKILFLSHSRISMRRGINQKLTLQKSGGLKPTGAINGDCSSSKGQVYVRTTECGGRRAIMYAWYMPKDQVIAGVENGHRHDWESTVVWLNAKNDNFIGISVSGHGGFTSSKNPNKYFSNGHPTIGYDKPFQLPDGVSHRCIFTKEVGGMQPMFDWARMDGKTQRALKRADFGRAVVPFKPGRYEDQLLESWIGDDAPNKC